MAEKTIEPIKDRDIVIIGLQSWDEPIGSNCKDLAVQFKKYNRVLYVNFPLNRQALFQKNPNDYLKKRLDVLRGRQPELVQEEDNFYVLNPRVVMEPSNWIKISFLFNCLNWINNYRFAKRILKAIKEINFSNFILFNDQDIYRGFYLPELLRPNRFIYYIRDYLLGVDFFKIHGNRLEPQLIKKADLVVCNSTFLQNYALKFSAKSYYVGQGCDLSVFDPSRETVSPSILDSIAKPRIGYIGALASHRLDRDLLFYIAENNPSWSIVLVGPEDQGFKDSPLHQLKNVFFTGNQPMSELPNFIGSFDVCINPQLLNDITIGNYPRKVDEYLAMGKPVVAVKTLTMEFFAKYVHLASNNAEFVEKIKLALGENQFENSQTRIQFASEHTWENSYLEISKAFQIEEERISLRSGH